MKEGLPTKKEDQKENGKERENYENLLKEYSPLIKLIAIRIFKKIPFGRIGLDELINAGNFGLFDATRKYDPSKSLSLKGYVEIRIRGEMLDFLRSQDLELRTMREREKLDGVKPLKFVNLEEIPEREFSFNKKNDDPFVNVSDKETSEKLFDIIEKDEELNLSPREKMIINLYYYKGLSFKEIGLQLEKPLTEGRVSQIHTKIIEKLREKLKDYKQ